MMFMAFVLAACVWLVVLAVRWERIERDLSTHDLQQSTMPEKSKAGFVISEFSFLTSVLLFCSFWIICYLISLILMGYAGYFSVFGILAIKTVFPVGKFFPWYAYVPFVLTSLAGAGIGALCPKKKSAVYNRIVWWLFATAVIAWNLGGLGYGVREPGDSGMGDLAAVLGSIPLFLIAFYFAFFIEGWILVFFARRNDIA